MDSFFLLVAIGTLVIAVRRMRRVAPLERRLADVEARLASLASETGQLHRLLRERPATVALPAPIEAAVFDELPTSVRQEPLAALDELLGTATATDAAAATATDAAAAAATATDADADAATDVVPVLPAAPVVESPPPAPPINWEQWLGVRGAAALGAVVLALAGIYFFQYSIQHGLISPSLRVVLGTLVGVGCIVASTRLRQYESSGNALAGGGAVVLYASFWAARALYQLIPMEAAFVMMALVTAVTALLSVRYASLLIASLGLAGGFLTPLLLSTGANKPFGLFGYLLVLDAGFLFVAYRRRWAGLALCALAGTLGLEALWVGNKMEPGQLAIALGASGLFALLFLASGARASKDGPRSRLWIATQAAAVLLPHAFALYFATETNLGAHLYPIALLLCLLEIAALYVARTMPPDGSGMSLAFLPTAAAAGSVTVVGSWLASVRLTPSLAWELTLVAILLTVPAVIATWRDRRDEARRLPAALLYPAGLAALLFAAATDVVKPWAFVTGTSALAALAYVQATLPGREYLALVAPVLLGAALMFVGWLHGDHTGFVSIDAYLLTELALFGLAFALALRAAPRRDAVARRAAEGALLLGALSLLSVVSVERFLRQPPLFVLSATLLWAALLVAAVVLRGDGWWMIAAVLPPLALFGSETDAMLHGHVRAPLPALALCVVAVLLFVRAPFVAWPRLRGRPAFYVASLAGLAWMFPTVAIYQDGASRTGRGAVPLVFAFLTMTAVPTIRRRFAIDAPERKSALVWVSAAALGLLSIAIPMELDRQWITIGYALEAACVLLLWQRLDHPGLKYFALALAAAVGVRLVANTSVLAYADRGDLRILNWILYTYWVPAIALLVAATTLAPLELLRLRTWERGLYQSRDKTLRPIGSVFLGLVVILIGFVWVNLAIADWYGTGHTLTLEFERRPARDLTTSIAWALYAILLLSLGVWRRSSGLRWTSLLMLFVTIGKVFLYDLGQLKDLYRVVSLLGLAASLIGVSLAYQRFVFRRPAAPPSPEKPA